MILQHYKNLPVPEDNAMVHITTQQVLFNANWNNDKFWS